MDSRHSAGRAIDLERVLLYTAALATGVAGLGHLSAARDHPAHAHIAAFFVVLGVAQVSWAAAVTFRPAPRLVRAGVIGNAAVVAIWVVSRTTGIPLVPGAGDVEAVAIKDAVTTFLELLAIGAGGLLLALPAEARRAIVPSSDRVVGALIAGALLLSLPATLGSNGHGAGHGVHGDGVHAQVAGATTDAGHGHGGEGAAVHEATGHVADQHVEHVAAPEHTGGHGSGGGSTVAAGHGGVAHEGHHGSASSSTEPPPGELTSVRYGPFTLPPASSNDARHDAVISNTILTQLPPPCRDCYLTSVDFDLVYQDGRSANYDTGAMLHHHVMFDSTEEDPTCSRFGGPIGGAGKRIFASGNERTSGSFPRGFGYYIDNEDWWTGIFEIMNLVEQPQTVWVNVAVHYLPGSDTEVVPVTPVWLDVDNCGDSEIDVPAGRTTTTWDWTSNVTGRIVTTAGHVHDGGTSITLSNATTGAHVCRSVAGYGTKPEYMGHIESMSGCTWDRIGAVRKGEVLRLSTVYDTPEPLEGVMGIMMAFVYETDDLTGGTPAPDSMTSPPEGGTPTVAPHQH